MNGQPFFSMVQALLLITHGVKRKVYMHPIRVRRGIRMQRTYMSPRFCREPSFFFEFTTRCLLEIAVGFFNRSCRYFRKKIAGRMAILAYQDQAVIGRNRHYVYPVRVRKHVVRANLPPSWCNAIISAHIDPAVL